MGLQWAEHTIEIDATPDQVFDAITDYETFPKWQSAVLGTEVVERERKSKLGEVVKYEVDGKIRTIYYTLHYHYNRPEKIGWDYVEGKGINQLDGGYEIVPSGTGTAATYKVGIDVSGVPGPILKRTHKATIKKANEDLKKEAERRARADGGGSGDSDADPNDWTPPDSDGESVVDAATEVVSASVNLAKVAGSKAIGVLGRLRP